MAESIYQFSAKNNKGEERSLADYKNRVLLIVNTASACGFTPQYQGLEQLYQELHSQGLEVLAFPCNQFGQQEKGDDETIRSFCDLNFNINFELFSKIEVNGSDAHPLYNFLKKEAPGVLGTQKIKWNFTKFLVNRNGDVIKRYSPTTKPESIKKDILAIL